MPVLSAYIAADGMSWDRVDPATQMRYWNQYANTYGADAAVGAWLNDYNANLLHSGKAVQTKDGIISTDVVRQHLIDNGYKGLLDLASMQAAYNLLQTPPPAPAAPPPASPLGTLPMPVLIGGGAALLLVLMMGRRR